MMVAKDRTANSGAIGAWMQRYEHFIDGVFRRPDSGRWFDSFDPFTGRPWAQVAEGSAADVDVAVTAARRAFESGPWPQLTATARGALLRRLGDAISQNATQLAELETRDNGKLYTEMYGQVNYLAQWYHYYGGLADKIEGTVLPMNKPGYFTFTRKEPVGVTALLTPWNSPLLLLTWKLAPAPAAGCTAVIKPSEFTSISTLELARLFTEAGLPAGVVNVVTGYGADVGAPLVARRSTVPSRASSPRQVRPASRATHSYCAESPLACFKTEKYI